MHLQRHFKLKRPDKPSNKFNWPASQVAGEIWATELGEGKKIGTRSSFRQINRQIQRFLQLLQPSPLKKIPSRRKPVARTSETEHRAQMYDVCWSCSVCYYTKWLYATRHPCYIMLDVRYLFRPLSLPSHCRVRAIHTGYAHIGEPLQRIHHYPLVLST
ncbi:hypothetical protein BDP27DRAFT_70704 [Rhodocollybia butyracea]|uniref:Uncharacterized protein n=1 Tax=Rhodocollybia butyracea TaxID=206335 RepID=A0A9P5U2Z9_9AGAR|nr:hypothetical protein BDP27DRAFT_70704 [Rhodocollybia butyracea]